MFYLEIIVSSFTGILPPVGLQINPVNTEIRIDSDVYCFNLEDKIWSIHSNMTAKRKRHQVTKRSKLF